MYVEPNFKTKKALKDAVKDGRRVIVWSPSCFVEGTNDGKFSVEGPHYPEPHRWYASVETKDGRVVKVS